MNEEEITKCIEAATRMGSDAFRRGMKSTPRYDNELTRMVERSPDAPLGRLIMAWYKGYKEEESKSNSKGAQK